MSESKQTTPSEYESSSSSSTSSKPKRYAVTNTKTNKGVDALPSVVSQVDAWEKERKLKAFRKLKDLYEFNKEPEEQKKLIECDDEDVRILVNGYGVLEHFKTTDSHRRAITAVLELLQAAKVSEAITTEMKERAKVHDMSKYDCEEATGYTHRWVYGADTPEWEVSLKHHYHYNSHHPEFFGDQAMDVADIAESVLDMLAVRFERILGGFKKDVEDKTISLKNLVGIESFYLKRYTEADGKMAMAFYENWHKQLEKVFQSDRSSFSQWEKWYDRTVVE